jgi:hypothetical protein
MLHCPFMFMYPVPDRSLKRKLKRKAADALAEEKFEAEAEQQVG